MKKQQALHWFATLLAAFIAVTAPAADKKPNVVFILADNVGYGDLGCYGGGELRGAPTPRLDQLSREGLRLTQFLVEPACTPSRTALMTGQYSIRSGLSLIAIEGTSYTLPGRAFTMGDMFKHAGYATAIFGKWHLGGAPQSLPTAHGFDEFYGIPPGHFMGFGDLRQHNRNDPFHPGPARRAAGKRAANSGGDGGQRVAQGQTIHAGSAGGD